MSVSQGDDVRGDERGVISAEILGGEEITVFPDSAAVLDLDNRTVSVAVGANDSLVESDGLMFYDERDGEVGSQSLFYATWRRTEAVCYFAALVIVFVILAFFIYFVFVMLMVRRNSSRSSESGVRWTRLRQRQ